MRRSFLSSTARTLRPQPAPMLRAAYDPEAFEGGQPPAGIKSQFPQLQFTPLAGPWSASSLHGADLLIARADAADPRSVERIAANLRGCGAPDRVVVSLANADLETTRRLIREGAGDVIPEPVGELALAAGLDRAISRIERAGPDAGRSSHVVAFLKAGGGSGATAVATQTATIAAGNPALKVCVVDLDIQFGQAGLYLDIQPSISMAQVLSTTGELSEMGFGSTLTPHASGARVLAAPPEFTPLESLTSEIVDGLITAMRREFDLVLLDLPSAWTAWTYRALRQSDHIVIVTQLSVPHAHLTRRQLQLLETQRLDDVPLTLLCNRMSPENAAGVSQRSVEAAIGRGFDVVAPEERKLMNEAINQGVALASVRRGSKLERSLQQLADRITPARAKQTKTGRVN